MVLRGGKDLGRWKVTDGASLVAQFAKNLCAVQEILIQSLGWEDPLEKGMATHSSILAWRIPWTFKKIFGSRNRASVLIFLISTFFF